jgi:ABC-type Fe3+-hydroxamate transport system substrate-binding protein
MNGRRALLSTLTLVVVPPARAGDIVGRDSLGRTVRLRKPAERIVALIAYPAYGNLGALGRPVAASILHPAYLLHAHDLFHPGPPPRHVGHADWTPDAERIAALAPDLILTYGATATEVLENLAPTFSVRMDVSVAAWLDSQIALGTLVGQRDLARYLADGFAAKLDWFRSRAPNRPSLAIVSASGTQLWMYGGPNVIKEVLATVAEPDSAHLNPRLPWGEISLEAMHRIDPDAILLISWNDRAEVLPQATLRRSRLWPRLRAVREGRVLALNAYEAHTFKCLPTMARLLDLVAAFLHPQVFPQRPVVGDRVTAILGG